jgi:ribosomal protein L23
MKASSQLRSAGQDIIKIAVKDYFNVTEGDVKTINWLQKRDQFMYPGGSRVSCLVISLVSY